MKCDELKPLVFLLSEFEVYKANEVDAAIAELKAENERLKKCEVWMKQHFYCEEVIACESAKNRRLKRALWLARAERAKERKYKYETWERNEMKKFNRDGDLIAIVSMKARKWRRVEIKCLKKAEEYK